MTVYFSWWFPCLLVSSLSKFALVSGIPLLSVCWFICINQSLNNYLLQDQTPQLFSTAYSQEFGVTKPSSFHDVENWIWESTMPLQISYKTVPPFRWNLSDFCFADVPLLVLVFLADSRFLPHSSTVILSWNQAALDLIPSYTEKVIWWLPNQRVKLSMC